MRGDCLATWLTVLAFMDLGWPRAYRHSMSVLCTLHEHRWVKEMRLLWFGHCQSRPCAKHGLEYAPRTMHQWCVPAVNKPWFEYMDTMWVPKYVNPYKWITLQILIGYECDYVKSKYFGQVATNMLENVYKSKFDHTVFVVLQSTYIFMEADTL